MTRVSRVPYHQNVYDLLQVEPGECPEARRMIEEHEAKHGPLPASVREWYLSADEPWVLLGTDRTLLDGNQAERPLPLREITAGFTRLSDPNSGPYIRLMGTSDVHLGSQVR